MKYLVVAVAVVAAGCSKKSDNAQPAAGASAPGPAGAAAKPAAGGATKWLAVDALHVELQVPSCAELTMTGDDAGLIVDQGADCPQMSVGLQRVETPESFDDHVKGIVDAGAIKRAVTRKDKTADGWIVESTMQNAGDSSPAQVTEVQVGNIQCIANSFNPAEAAAQRAACESMRKK